MFEIIDIEQCTRTMTFVNTVHTPVAFGASLRSARTKLGWTQQQLADRAGLARQTVIRIEAGNSRAEIGVVMRLARAVGLDLALIPADRDARSSLDDMIDGLTGA
jgi:transcriptional regulator with XRE-family HTH domain